MCKKPEAGKVKTRIAAKIGPQRACLLAAELLLASVEKAVSAWPGSIKIAFTPNSDHEVFDQISNQYGLDFCLQCEGNLGDRMLNLLNQGVQSHGSCALIGSDSPHCQAQVLADAYERLNQGRNCIAPTQDGGFYLIGTCEVYTQLFNGVTFSHQQTLAQTLRAGARIGMQYEVFEKFEFDVDTIEDLRRLSAMDGRFATFI